MTFKSFMAVVFTVAFLANTATAETPNPLTLSEKVAVGATQKNLLLSLADTEPQDVKVSIETKSGTEVFSEMVALKATTTRRYDLKILEAGSYNLVIEKKREKFIQPFDINFTNINVNAAQLEQFFLPTINLKGDILDISVPSFSKPQVSVKIFDSLGFPVFEESAKTMVFSKRLNLSQLRSGSYVVEIQSYGSETTYFTIVR